MKFPQPLKILSLPHKVLLPGIVFKLQIDQKEVNKVIEHVAQEFAHNKQIYIGVCPSKDDELIRIGVVAKVVDVVKHPLHKARPAMAIVLHGECRFQVDQIIDDDLLTARVTYWYDSPIKDAEFQALLITLKKLGNDLIQALNRLNFPASALVQFKKMLELVSNVNLTELLASMIDLSWEERLDILKTRDINSRMIKVSELLSRQIEVLKISEKLQVAIEDKIGKKHRDLLLRQQLELIKKELGEEDDAEDDLDQIVGLQKRLKDAKLPEMTNRIATRELRKLKKMNSSMAEYQVVRTYVEWLLEIPWTERTVEHVDLQIAKCQLDKDHYGLNNVKTRILQYLSVRKLKKGNLKGPILCFVGPPGVGKTSLGKSIAATLDRKFYRISLGGVRDEAEIRGHRRTYVGAMPGTIIQALKRVGTNNPVILLDEIDKLSRDYRGDPASALLEVLDPGQNSSFTDHYINLPVDLSNVLFIATANETETIPSPLLDRMEVIRVPGYAFDEKQFIAKKFLIPKQLECHGLEEQNIIFTNEAINKIVTGYTREAGVRGLEREIARICRYLAAEVAESLENSQKSFTPIVDLQRVILILGVEKYQEEVSEIHATSGVVMGLAATADGSGGILFIEATMTNGTGKVRLTGKLGDVIKESAHIGCTWVQSNALHLGISETFMDKKDIHIHFPAGAVPKDGPSAGIAIVAAIVSLLRNEKPIPFTAMTGEVTLRGKVLPVGGIKEKVLAAHRAGVKRIILPESNRKELEQDVRLDIRNQLSFFFASSIMEVLEFSLRTVTEKARL